MVFLTFLKLGCLSFGGPAAHLGYFRQEFVVRKRWLGEADLSEIIALTQLLPGPGSSQTGFLIGMLHGGLWGAVQAWLGFTMPSAILLILFAAGTKFTGNPFAAAALRGLQLAGIAVIANAILAMHRTLSPDAPRSAIAAITAVFVLLLPGSLNQALALIAAGVLGVLLLKQQRLGSPQSTITLAVSKRTANVSLLLFLSIFAGLEVFTRISGRSEGKVIRAFFDSGALVFGGGHVVLPLLEQAVVKPGWVTQATFLSGYGAAQAIPGPLFTFAAYLGYLLRVAPNRIGGAVICLVALFLPGLLLVIAAAPHWQILRQNRRARLAIAGVNASVVGLLFAALISVFLANRIRDPASVALIIGAFLALLSKKVSPVAVVLGSATIAGALRLVG